MAPIDSIKSYSKLFLPAYDICSVPDFCTNGGTCTPLGGVGQFECSCPMGYTGERCQDLVDNCVSGVCLNGGECINALNSFSCHCAQGFTGGFCEVDIDECASYPCKNGGLCVDKVSDYECVCPDTVDGTRPSKNCSGGSLVYSCSIRVILPQCLLPTTHRSSLYVCVLWGEWYLY